VLGIATGILVARWLGPSGKGVFSGLGLLQGAVTAAVGGVGASVTYLLTKRGRTIPELLPALGVLLGAVSALTWFGLLLWGLFRGFSATWLVFFLSVPAATVLSWQGYMFLGLGRVRTLNKLSLARGSLLIALLFVAVYLFHGGTIGALVAWAVTAYMIATYTVAYAMRVGQTQRVEKLREDLKELLRFGARSNLDGFLGFINYRLDSILIIAYLGAAGYGIYSVAVAGGELLYMISRSVAAASAHAIGSSSLTTSAEVAAKAIRTTTAAIALMAAVLFIIAPLVIKLLYGGKFVAAIVPLRILLPGVVAFAPAGIFSSFFSYQLGRPMFGVYLTLGLIAMEAGACVLLVPKLGLAGAAIACTVTYMSSTLGETWYFRKVTGMSPASIWMINRDDVRLALRSIALSAKSRG
jgi:O-antigen/teichoic acid export membrane protein